MKEIMERLDLIQIVACVVGSVSDPMERNEMSGLIEALCRHRELPVSTCLSQPRDLILEREAAASFQEWRDTYAAKAV